MLRNTINFIKYTVYVVLAYIIDPKMDYAKIYEISRSSHPEVFLKRGVSKNLANF